jgi:pimeloyl-ACP methyl ester carboxylesterase
MPIAHPIAMESFSMHLKPPPGLLVLLGWDDDGQHRFDAMRARLEGRGWICRRADLPDSRWPAARRAKVSRASALCQALQDYYALECAVQGGPIAVAGFSFGAYMGAFLAVARPVRYLILRSPAIYADAEWSAPKEALDRGDVARYREQHLAPSQNRALACCARFEGDVLLVESGNDQVIPPSVAASYAAAFSCARSLSRHTVQGADHQLTDPAWQEAYGRLVVGWLTDRLAEVRARDEESEPKGSIEAAAR